MQRKHHLHRYERRYIERWLAGGRNLCPSTGTVLALPATLVPNVALRKSIEVWAEKQARWLLVMLPPQHWIALTVQAAGNDKCTLRAMICLSPTMD